MLRRRLRREPRTRSVILNVSGITFYINVRKQLMGYYGKIEFCSNDKASENVRIDAITKAICFIKEAYK